MFLPVIDEKPHSLFAAAVIKGMKKTWAVGKKIKLSFQHQGGKNDRLCNQGQDEINSQWHEISITEKLDLPFEVGNPAFGPSICRVSDEFREVDKKAYEPTVVSIGPYHRNKERLRQMEYHKWRFLDRALRVTQQNILTVLPEITKLEDDARKYYDGSVDLCSKDFVEMMVLDGCFVLEVMRGDVEGSAVSDWLPCIRRDMLMLENQLPWFILKRLLEITGIPNDQSTNFLAGLAVKFFNSMNHCELNLDKYDLNSHDGLHLLHIFLTFLLPEKVETQTRSMFMITKPTRSLHCVSELLDAGIELTKGGASSFLDIRFKNGVLTIPPLLASTKTLFLNLLAFEQCYPHWSKHITSYVSFMQSIVDSPVDVAILRNRGIIENRVGTGIEVVDLFNKLYRNITLEREDSYLSPLLGEVNDYYNQKWHEWWATFRRKHFSNPLTITTFVAATFLLLLTVIQTIYAMIDYHHPHSS